MALRSSEMKYGVRAPDRARSKCKEGKVIKGPSKEPQRATVCLLCTLSLLVSSAVLDMNGRDGHALAPIRTMTWSGWCVDLRSVCH